MQKVKILLSLSVAAMSIAALSSCSDEDFGYTSADIAYKHKFEETFGKIDPSQDFNLATRAAVTVSTSQSSNIKIYAYCGDKYQIVGDYANVNGTNELKIDVVKGTNDLLVTDGKNAVKTTVGGSVSFSGTRAIHTTTDPSAFVKITTVPAEGITIGQKLYPQFLEIANKNYEDLTNFIPEIDNGPKYRKYTNLNKVTHDFLYVSTGKFVIYPYYWVTNATDKLGIYYYNGDTKVEVPVYDIKGDELTYYDNNQGKRVPFTAKDCNDIFKWGTDAKSQGIVIDIPVGTVFGMYLTNSPSTFYSQSALNKDEGYAVIDNGNGTISTSATEYASYASTFELDGLMLLGFEDWSNKFNASDMDLNDVVFAFSGATPTVIDEDPTTTAWVLACEDLGSTFDTDYNDVVFAVEHVSGRTTATVTPLAAGGTLASNIFWGDTDLGEIHQLLGAAPAETGSYAPINVGSSRGSAGLQKTIIVDKDFSMASSQVGTITSSGNMGGFVIKTTYEDGVKPSVIAAPAPGQVPEMICLPYTYQVENDPEDGKVTTYYWAWSMELKSLANINGGAYGTGSYPEFKEWVSNYNTNTDWYKHPVSSLTVAEKKDVANMSSSGGGSGQGSEPANYGTLLSEKATYYRDGNTSGMYRIGYKLPASELTADTELTITVISDGTVGFKLWARPTDWSGADQKVDESTSGVTVLKVSTENVNAAITAGYLFIGDDNNKWSDDNVQIFIK